MYLSCISTTEGKHPDKTFLAPPQNKERLSEWRFAREEPTPQDWKLWEDFWRKYCNRHFELPAPMGRWEHPGHRVWPWLLHEEQNVVYRQSYHLIHAYILLVQGRTILGGLYIYLGEVNIVPIKVVPISVDKVESDVIKIRGGGTTLPLLQQKAQTFWEGLYLRGGTWMWDYMLDVTSEPSWLPLAL